MRVYRSRTDLSLLGIPVAIFFIGLFFIYSASWREGRPLDESLVLRQSLWMGFAVVMTLVSLRIPYRHLLDIAWPFYGAVNLLLVLVFVMPTQMGAHRWIDLGPFNLQPSELAKLGVITALAAFMKDNRFVSSGRSLWWVPFVITGLPFLLILKEPDLGTALVFIPVLLSMLYVWGFNMKWIFSMILGGALISPLLFHGLKDYQKQRVLTFLDPSQDPLGAGYTIIQSKIAIGSGGLFGKGFLSGTQTQLQFIPEKHTDFIFSVIGEEGGFVGAFLVMAGYWVLVYKGFSIAQHCHNRFGKYLATGISTLLAFQAIVNMAMTTGLLPVVGMPLLLVSYGGSSLIVSMLLVGLLANIKRYRDPFM